MADRPQTLLLYGYPQEATGDPAALESAIRTRVPDIDLVRATDHADARERIANAEILIEHGLTDDILDAAENLRWLQSLSAGYDRYDLDTLRDRGVTLTTVSGVHARPIAEHVIGYLLLFEREFLQTLEQGRRRAWRRRSPSELGGRTVGIVGVGEIGGRIADLVSAFGCEVLGVKRDPSTAPESVDECVSPTGLHGVLGRSDYVVVACPLTDETEGMIGAPELASMRESILINIARGPIVDHSALVAALQDGTLRGAALDVTDPEPLPESSRLWSLSNVVITPHMAGGSPHYTDRCADLFAENYEAYTDGRLDDLRNRVC